MIKTLLVDGNNCFDDFLQDIQIINDALCNVTFGVGGPYLLSLAFSKNNVSFLPFIHKSPHCEVVAKLNKISNKDVIYTYTKKRRSFDTKNFIANNSKIVKTIGKFKYTEINTALKKTYDYYQDGFVLSDDQINLLIIGNVVGFIVALVAIKSFIGFLTKYGFKVFGYYRIVAGIAILLIHFFVQKLTII